MVKSAMLELLLANGQRVPRTEPALWEREQQPLSIVS